MNQSETSAPSGLWESIVAYVEQRIGARACTTWVRPASIKGLAGGVLKLCVPSRFFCEWLAEHYAGALNEAASSALGRPVKVELEVRETPAVRAAAAGGDRALDSEPPFEPAPASKDPTSATGRLSPGNGGSGSPGFAGRHGTSPSSAEALASGLSRDEPFRRPRALSPLNSNYTFDSFVVAGSNQLAAAACRAVCERPGSDYNPLFIYGGSGLGKTHMLHAIGHAASADDPYNGVCYVSAERFMNEMIASIQQGTALAFRNKYRRARLLLIDDVHFLGGKESTQEEFFHTFNSLHEAGRQIVLTSDRPPKEIPRIEDRLISRFTWGLVADIQKPDLETRVAILRKKAARQGVRLTTDVALTIAQMASDNVRELEGALLRVKALAQVTGKPLTPDVVAEVLGDILQPSRRPASVQDVQRIVARHFGLRPQDLSGRKRTAAVAFPRQVAMYLCRAYLDTPLAEIGEKFGGRDHTTALYAFSKVESQLKTDRQLKKTISLLSDRLLGRVENMFMN